LLKARTLNDLVVQSDERQLLWQSLRERASQEQTYKADLPEADIPPEVLMALLGINELPDVYEVSDVPEGSKVPDATIGSEEAKVKKERGGTKEEK
jgi:hypothetical protein